jgi:hypothetical protein
LAEEDAMDRQQLSNSGATRVRVAAVAAFGAAALVAGGHPRAALAVEGAVQYPATGHWYLYVAAESPADWATSSAAAAAAGGYLASVGSVEENDWIVANLLAPSGATAWIGGSDTASEGSWTWADGEQWSFANWAPGEPSDSAGAENWLAMAADGTWSDEAAGQALTGYVVEWDTDPNSANPPSAPTAPTNLVAVYSQGAGVALTWSDGSADEAGFVVERLPSGLTWSVRHTADADAEAWTDFALVPATTYTYRVAAVGSGGQSAFSNEVSVTTSATEAPPAPPAAPTALAAAVAGPSSVEVTWNDNSGDETLFDLERAAGGAGFAKLSGRPADSVAFTDETVHPGWPYAYRVRALSLQGPSAFSSAAAVDVPPTMTLATSSGTLTRSVKPGRDAVRTAATFASLAGTGVPSLDPVGQGLDLQVGPASAPVLVKIAANDPAWKTKVRKGEVVKATWRSRKGASPKVAVTLDLVRGTMSVTASAADFAQDPSADVRLLLACGENSGAASGTWTQRRPGVLKFR